MKNFQRCLFVIVCVVFGFCLQKASSESRFTLGVAAPLTGDLAEYGAAVRNGITLAQEQNSDSFRSLEFVFDDNRFEAVEAIKSYRKLRDSNEIDALFSWGEPPFGALAPLAERDKFPLIAMSLDSLPARGNQFTQLIINPSDDFAATILDWIRRKKFSRVGVVKADDSFMESMVRGLQSLASETEKIEIVANVPVTENDFRTVITKLKRGKFDVVAVYLQSGQARSFFKQAASLGLSVPFFGTDVFESRAEIAASGASMQGATYPNLKVPKEFLTAYVKRFGNDSQITYAYNAYVVAKTLARLFPDGRGDLSSEGIMKLLRGAASMQPDLYSKGVSREGTEYYKFPMVVREVRGDGVVDLE